MKKAAASKSTRISKTPYTDEQIAKGDWNPLWDTLREWDGEFMEAYLAFRNVPHRNGPLPPKVKELILIAINAATTHLYGPGIRRHMKNALKLGSTREEILEVLQLTTVLGIHACNMGVPILAEELASAERSPKIDAAKRVTRKRRA
jgi:alkylhydroperoxidase/carboxymuconolactone decarboxylase family protein YurZ